MPVKRQPSHLLHKPTGPARGRNTVNALIQRVRRVFKWDVENDYVSASVDTELVTGRSDPRCEG